MRYIVILISLLNCIYSRAQTYNVYYDKDSNEYSIINGDTVYVQTAFSQDMNATFGSSAHFFNTERDYHYYPHFKGSVADYLKKNLQYPKEAMKKGIEGKVTVTFVVDEQGNLHDIKAGSFRKADSVLIKEAIRLVENMPAWRPARSRQDDVTPISSPGGLTIPFELY